MKTKTSVVVAYKGFNPGLECRGFKYQVGETYKTEEGIKLCGSGFHACEYPLDVFNYYAPASSVFAKVEQSGDIEKGDDKQASSVITIKASLSLQGLIAAAVEYTFARANKPVKGGHSTGTRGAASSTGTRGAASSTGTRGAASSTGYQGAASSTGTRGAASSTGYQGAASSTGDQGAASSTGDQGAASSTGYQGAASNGGKDGVAAALGYSSKAKSCLGGIIVVAWYDEKNDRKRVTVGYPGEAGIKADTWYVASAAGELVEDQ
jgi:hypothetical protein